jgi:hypothetical protein
LCAEPESTSALAPPALAITNASALTAIEGEIRRNNDAYDPLPEAKGCLKRRQSYPCGFVDGLDAMDDMDVVRSVVTRKMAGLRERRPRVRLVY